MEFKSKKEKLVLSIWFLTLILMVYLAASANASSLDTSTPPILPEPTASYDPQQPQILQDFFMNAETAVLIEQHSGKVLYDMQSNRKMAPASTTKIMTLLLALENGNLDDKVTVGSEIQLIPGDSSKVPLIEGEILTLEELLYGLIIKSGNDAAMTIAIHISGSVENFVALMNERAYELGCTGTQFANPHGYEDEAHYTNAMDLALIAREGMNNEDFRKIVGTESFTIASNNLREEDSVLMTRNQFVGRSEEMEYQYEHGTGIKTGFFTNAQHTFVASASNNDIDLIAVVLRTSPEGKWVNSAMLMEYGFAICSRYSLDELYSSAPIELQIEEAESGETLTLDFAADQELFLTDTNSSIDEMLANFSKYYSFESDIDLIAPIEQGSAIGTLVFKPIGSEELRYQMIAANSVAAIPKATPNPSSAEINSPKPINVSAVNEDGKDAVSVLSKTISTMIVLFSILLVVLIICLIVNSRMKSKRKKR